MALPVAALFASQLLGTASGEAGSAPLPTGIQASASGPAAGGLFGGASSSADTGDVGPIGFGDFNVGGAAGASGPGWFLVIGAALVAAVALLRR